MPVSESGENDAALHADMSLKNLFGVEGKVAVVTGGGSGIGAMIAAALSRNGAKTYIMSRKDISGYAKELPGCVAYQCDVGDEESVKKAVQFVAEREGKVDILVNNAGTNFNAPIGKYPAAAFDKVMQINVRSVFSVTQEFTPLLEKAGTKEDPSRVINISSINGVRAPAAFDTFAYSSSKAGVIMLGKHLASKLGKKNITVNTICPGPFESRMMRGTIKMAGRENVAKGTVAGRIGAPEDVAATVLYLCGKGGSFTNGAEIILDGGALAKM
eukprot:TRINITY_DN38380_c0_g1_i1.p1 TRINITY_DN38380_c0_g1~~TRINITY_DN38380_c0_g1_i1.p1  ORF type:complete len:293 (+),score=88.28 TRINITY_DN38380_c0_g1_i1:66-881(+)